MPFGAALLRRGCGGRETQESPGGVRIQPIVFWGRSTSLPPPTRLNREGSIPFSMGLRPRLNADAAFAAFWKPGLSPGNDPFPNRRVVVLERVAHAAAAHGPEREPKESP